jgi:hypothetical protein
VYRHDHSANIPLVSAVVTSALDDVDDAVVVEAIRIDLIILVYATEEVKTVTSAAAVGDGENDTQPTHDERR